MGTGSTSGQSQGFEEDSKELGLAPYRKDHGNPKDVGEFQQLRGSSLMGLARYVCLYFLP